MDKELMIAQMEGKFKLVVLENVGHCVQEDSPLKLAQKFKEFIDLFKILPKANQFKVITNMSGKQIIIGGPQNPPPA